MDQTSWTARRAASGTSAPGRSGFMTVPRRTFFALSAAAAYSASDSAPRASRFTRPTFTPAPTSERTPIVPSDSTKSPAPPFSAAASVATPSWPPPRPANHSISPASSAPCSPSSIDSARVAATASFAPCRAYAPIFASLPPSHDAL